MLVLKTGLQLINSEEGAARALLGLFCVFLGAFNLLAGGLFCFLLAFRFVFKTLCGMIKRRECIYSAGD